MGLLLIVLGIFAVIIGDPGSRAASTIDTAELADIVQREVDHVRGEELADWIIQGRADYRLIDLRAPEEFHAYHIPGAENVVMTALADHGLLRNEKIVLYSDGGIHSAQAWFLLRARGYRGVYMLRGGLEEWKDSVLYPALPPDPTPAQRVMFAKMSEVSKFLGGRPQGTTSPDRLAPALPQTSMPPTNLPPADGHQKKKKKEGC
jgi:rhodanese-related sulfurtransferase